jgi:hypothetical protein
LDIVVIPVLWFLSERIEGRRKGGKEIKMEGINADRTDE